jgi:hypothetical protein
MWARLQSFNIEAISSTDHDGEAAVKGGVAAQWVAE